MTPRLSAVLIARDEADCLGRCLSSIRNVADEIVVLDTGSSDETPRIAEAHGARLFHGKWSGDFAAARNEALSHATGDWILWIDADEELVASVEQVRSLLAADAHAFQVEIENLTHDLDDTQRVIHPALRLFRRLAGTAWAGRIHEQVIGLGGPAHGVEGPFLRHFGYRPAVMAAKNKHARTIALLESEIAAEPENAFQRFNLANALLVAGRTEEAYHHARQATIRIPDRASYGALAWFVRLQCAPDAPSVLVDADIADQAGWGGLFVEFARTQAHLLLGEPEKALSCANLALTAPWPIDSAGDRDIAIYKSRFLRAQCFLALDNYSAALLDANDVVAVAPTFAPALRLKAECLRRLGQPCLAAFEAAWHAAPESLAIWNSWVEICEEQNEGSRLIAAYEALAQRRPLDAPLLVNWGRALENAGDEESALDKFRLAAEAEPNDPNVLLNLADAFARRGCWADAAGGYEAALRLNPQNPQAWFALGNAFAHSGLAASAIRAYDLCLRFDPAHEMARHNREIVAQAPVAA